MLDQDQEVEAKRKYMIFVSDGITYMYNQEPTVTAWSFENDGSILSWAGPDNFSSKYGQTLPDWNTYLKDVKQSWKVKEIRMIILMEQHRQRQLLSINLKSI